ncbi:DUF177 domain-containing protein [Chelatococcus sambhunathii]|uniref:DUF177 domain-containing protein n=1 Tax=Chelatococcus sambhunathii TaxID=363953 RepID=A0ABU1DDF8_9HYPH|nr:DUF177 domain-containing protein [Chelatococcus sambhunathii]MDR4306150.1 DUF177 domain-containing protein [Chelatococcus sambhunathii]
MSRLPLSRPLIVATVPPQGETIEIVADEAERAALAAENEVESIERLVARLDVRPTGRDGLSVRGRVEALTTRICVVTLDPFIEAVDEEVEVRFAPETESAARDAIEDGADDAPDPIVAGVVDLGAVVAEFFTLGLDPHPRKPGATFDDAGENRAAASPFAALRDLKRDE